MNWLSRWFNRRRAPRWWVLDDFFPNLLTGFRVAEYNALLSRFPGLRIASSYGDFGAAHAAYAARYPEHAPRVVRYSAPLLDGAAFVYLNFLNNAIQFLPDLEGRAIPFALTLYPGGGFGLDEPDSDHKLARVLASPLLRGVLVTQSVSRDYLRPRLPAGVPLEEIFGVVANPVYFAPSPPRAWYGSGKPAFDLAFVAEKYMPRGENKGFPAFVEGTGRWLAAARPAVAAAARIHVVGSFGPDDWRECAPPGAPAPEALPVTFHGRLETHALRALLHDVDLVVSPNRPFVLHAGNFDGFPTGCCVEASLCGAAFAATDPLTLNHGHYRDGVDFLQVTPDAAGVADAITRATADPAALRRLAEAGRAATRRWFDPAIQIGGRIAFLERMLGADPHGQARVAGGGP